MDSRFYRWASLGIGAGIMYLLDPVTGKERRARLQDKVIQGTHKALDTIDVKTDDLANRTYKLGSELRQLMEKERGSSSGEGFGSTSMGRGELERGQSGYGSSSMRSDWSPMARFLSGAAGTLAAAYGMGRRGVFGKSVSASGLMLLLRALSNKELTKLFGVSGSGKGVYAHKSIEINAPVETVFRFMSNYENFPRFMSTVKEIRPLDDRRSHWKVSGPAGVPVEWESILTAHEPNRLLAWTTSPDSSIQHSGTVTMHGNPEGTTTVDVKLTYKPIAGSVGHMVASLFRVDPESQLEEDLSQLKSLLEGGSTRETGTMGV